MAFEKIAQMVTGKSAEERKQEAAVNAIIRRKALAAQYQERERQAVRLATEREKISYDKRIKALKEPLKPMSMGMTMNYGSPFGQPRLAKAVMGSKKKVKRFDVIGGWR